MFLLSVAEIAATLIGLLLVGAFFYVETGLRRLGRAREAATSYLRAGTRIVLVLYGMTLALSLSLVALESIWTSGVLRRAQPPAPCSERRNVPPYPGVGKAHPLEGRVGKRRSVLGGDPGPVAIPWVLGGLHPTREDLTWAILLSLATGFLCTGTLVLSVFDLSKMEAAARAESRVGATGEARRPTEE